MTLRLLRCLVDRLVVIFYDLESQVFRLLFVLIINFTISGCSMTYSMQEARSLSDDEVAILIIETPFMNPYVYVSAIDGVSRGYGEYNTFRLVPGERHITLVGNSHSGFYEDPKVVVFEARSGRYYKIILTEISYRPYWTAGIADSSTGERVEIRVYSPECDMHPWRGRRCYIEQGVEDVHAPSDLLNQSDE
ncbi:hypothetical protein A6D6_00749 [Alcanivorax xiamenensis]|uniref:DUF2846 domain-containing protein n=1 Tax=Alcanivorax xiamenensis TaxID=1177156 RepID=A0ABQ6YCC2_9GAMM|nr:hypothetical protein A6D6_00749 [Alcanivorax xiamenensis]